MAAAEQDAHRECSWFLTMYHVVGVEEKAWRTFEKTLMSMLVEARRKTSVLREWLDKVPQVLDVPDVDLLPEPINTTRLL